MPAAAQIAAQRVHLLALADEASLQYLAAAARIRLDRAPLGGLDRHRYAGGNRGAERVIGAALVEHHLRPAVRQHAGRCRRTGVAQHPALGGQRCLAHLQPGGADGIARPPTPRQLGIEGALGAGRQLVEHRAEVAHDLSDAVAVQRGGDGRQTTRAQRRRIAAVTAGEKEEARQALGGAPADGGEQGIDLDRPRLAVRALEDQRARAAVTGEVHADRRRLAAQTVDQIVEFAHLVDHHAQVLVQGADDDVALPLVVEAAALRRRDVDQQAQRGRGR